ncbi:MAG: MFS transporter [Actinomycetota bacterium]|nr:MFS transporter [Actinomycetota bacterium]
MTAGATFRRGLARTFSALGVPNYRRYAFGQAVSLTGTWMQRVAQAWLVLELGGTGTELGLVTGLQFLPLLLFGMWGGLVVDRVDTRRLLVATQAGAAVLALVLGVLVATGAVQLWMVMGLATALGVVHLFDNPGRQAFVLEMVAPDQLANAVTLNSVAVNAARVLGPAVAAGLITTAGLAACFVLNAVSYLAVIAAFASMRRHELRPGEVQRRGPGQLREGLAYVWRTPELRRPLLAMAVVGTLAYEFQVVLPLMARFAFDGGAAAYGAMTSCMGVGAVVGGLVLAGRDRSGPRSLALAGYGFGASLLAAAAAPTLAVELVALVGVGVGSIAFLAAANTLLQLGAAPAMRGRVMALWAVAFLGSTPVGGPLIGWVGEHLGPRVGLALGGVATVVAAAVLLRERSSVRDPAIASAGAAGAADVAG